MYTFLNPEDAVYRAVLQAGNGFQDAEQPGAAVLSASTNDMLREFSYLPEAKAREIVIENPNKIADMIDADVRAIPKGLYTPTIEGGGRDAAGRYHAQCKAALW